MPTHIKLDVDGNEYIILQGADKLLSSGVVKSLIVEYNMPDGAKIESYLNKYGYVLKEHQLTSAGKKKLKKNIKIEQIAHNILFVKK